MNDISWPLPYVSPLCPFSVPLSPFQSRDVFSDGGDEEEEDGDDALMNDSAI